MIIDSHLHVHFNGMDVRGLVDYLDATNVDKGFLLTWEEDHSLNPGYRHLSPEHALEAFRQYPDRFVPMYAPDPTRRDAPARLAAFCQAGGRGCAELKTALSWEDERLTPLLAQADQLGVPVIFHMETPRTIYLARRRPDLRLLLFLYRSPRVPGVCGKFLRKAIDGSSLLTAGIRACQLDFPGYLASFAGLEARLRQFPHLRFIGHGPLFWQGIAAWDALPTDNTADGPVAAAGISVNLLREYPNLFADLSGDSGYNALTRDPKFTPGFLTEFSHKLLYGTDNLSLGLKTLLDAAPLTREQRDRIFCKNALACLEGGTS